MQLGHDERELLQRDLRALVETGRLSVRDARILEAARRRYESRGARGDIERTFATAVAALAAAVSEEIPSGIIFDLGLANGPASLEGQWVVGSAISHIGIVQRHDGAIAIVRARPRCATELLAEFGQ